MSKAYFAKKNYSITSTVVPPGQGIVNSPVSKPIEGAVHRKIHFASSGLALTQPCDMGSPKLLCQKVEWIAAPAPANMLVHATAGVSHPPPEDPPLIWRERSFLQIGKDPIGVAQASTACPAAFHKAPEDIRQ
jgi:hypothetical protein